jgi:signal transduction histidine kinase
MKRIYFFLLPFLLLMQAIAFGQDTELNQLLSMKDDTVKVQQLSTYAKKVVHKDHELSRKASSALLKISQDLNYAKGIATGYSYLAFIELQEEHHAAATDLYNKAITYYRKANDERGVAKCLGNMADLYESRGQGDKAIDARLQAVNILEKLLPTATNKADVMHGLSIQYNNFATTYSDLFLNNEKALEYLRKAENICRQAKDTSQLLDVLANMSALLAVTSRLDEALKVGKEAYYISKFTDDNFLLSHGYYSYGFVMSEMNRLDSATLLLRQALQYAKASGSHYSILVNTVGLAQTLAKQGAYKEEIALLLDAFNNVASEGAIKYKADIEKELAKAYFNTGDYKSAYQHLENRFLFRDSVIKLANNNIIAEKETKYQTAQKEKELAQKELLLQKSRLNTVYGFLAALAALLIAAFVYVHYLNKRRLHQSQIQSLQKEKEIQLLQALMQGEEKERSRIAKDLHDGVAGMLAAVKMHLSSDNSDNENSYTKAIELLNEAHAEVRKTSHNLMPEVLLQHGLDHALQRYCSNISSTSLRVHYFFIGEEQRFTDSFELSIYRIVQELLNNIFKHSRATEATVQLSIQEHVLSVSIEDNGIGLSKQSQDGGMGLELLKRRVHTLNGNMELTTEKGGGVNAYLEFGTESVKKEYSEADVILN